MMTPSKLRARFYLGAICVAVVANDYLPSGATLNAVAAAGVLALEIWIAEKILKQFFASGSAP